MVAFGRYRSESPIRLNFLSANYFPFTGSIIVSQKLPFLGSKKPSPQPLGQTLGAMGDNTSKRKSKCFYFKIHHLQLSSKFVSPPICRLHISSHLGNWLKIIFSLHTPRPFPPLRLLLRAPGNDERIPCFISGTKFKYINQHDYTGNRELINSKSFLVFLLPRKKLHPAKYMAAVFLPPSHIHRVDPSFGKFVLRNVSTMFSYCCKNTDLIKNEDKQGNGPSTRNTSPSFPFADPSFGR